MAGDAIAGVQDALEELVHQFADPLSCLRELIQNAIDAGTTEVEVGFEFEEGDGESAGAMVIRVQDWGGGMDREIIDNKLTRLFSSGKDGDRTKIGKFGIGFVSVFALQPEAVCVDTGRAGERWRILFDAERKFTRARLDEAIEGTTVRVIKSCTSEEFEDLRGRARRTVAHWCRHAHVDILFDGDRLNQDFELEDEAFQIVREHQGRTLVLGHRGRDRHYHGFYNRGLTLHEGPGSIPALAGLSVKVLAGDLEHTLTRDAVIENEAYQDVVEQLMTLAHSDLMDETFARLELAVAGGTSQAAGEAGRAAGDAERAAAEIDRLYDGAIWHIGHLTTGRVKPSSQTKARKIFETADGRRVTLGEILALGDGKGLLISAHRSHLSDALAADGKTVLRRPESPAGRIALKACASDGRMIDVVERWVLPRPPADVAEIHRWQAFAARCHELLEAVRAKIDGVEFGHFKYPGSPVGRRVAITMRTTAVPVELEDVGAIAHGFFGRSRNLVINADHAAVEALLELATSEPELAAYKLVKMFLLEAGELDMKLEAERVVVAWELRCRRVAN